MGQHVMTPILDEEACSEEPRCNRFALLVVNLRTNRRKVPAQPLTASVQAAG